MECSVTTLSLLPFSSGDPNPFSSSSKRATRSGDDDFLDFTLSPVEGRNRPEAASVIVRDGARPPSLSSPAAIEAFKSLVAEAPVKVKVSLRDYLRISFAGYEEHIEHVERKILGSLNPDAPETVEKKVRIEKHIETLVNLLVCDVSGLV